MSECQSQLMATYTQLCVCCHVSHSERVAKYAVTKDTNWRAARRQDVGRSVSGVESLPQNVYRKNHQRNPDLSVCLSVCLTDCFACLIVQLTRLYFFTNISVSLFFFSFLSTNLSLFINVIISVVLIVTDYFWVFFVCVTVTVYVCYCNCNRQVTLCLDIKDIGRHFAIIKYKCIFSTDLFICPCLQFLRNLF